MLSYRVLSENLPSGTPILRQPVHFVGRGTIGFGDGVSFGVFPSPSFLNSYGYLEARNPEASIWIGARTQINNNFSAIAEHTRIDIGTDCLIGINVEILDSDFHSMDPEQRTVSSRAAAKPVKIGNNVFIGAHTKVLKGVRIGDNSVIAAASVVTSDIPPNVIAGGCPARVLKPL